MRNEIRTRVLLVLLGAALLLGSPSRSFAQSFKPRETRAVPGELIVKYRNAGFGRVAAESVQKDVLAKYQMEALSTIPFFGVQRVSVSNEKLASTIERLRADPNIAFVTRNYIVYADQMTPNDPRWGDLWGLQKIGMPAAWQKTQGDAHVVVAVLDTGVDFNHPDLTGNVWKTPAGDFGMSFCTDFSDESRPKVLPPQPGAMDISASGHGTHVAGTIAALGNNGVDVAGVAWKVRIMALRFLCAKDGSGTTADAIRAMEYAVTNGAHIMNNSWGGGPADVALETAIQETNARGILFVASAGNSAKDQGVSPNYPAGYRVPNVVAVAASNAQDTLASFSNWSGTLVPIAAPGVNILSTLPGNRVGPLDGTSMAAPHVTGCAALLKAVDLKRQAPELKKLLLDSADAVGALKGKVEKGRLNCANALR